MADVQEDMHGISRHHWTIYGPYYESQPVGLAEVIDASEASLGGPGGRAGKMSINRVK